MPWYVALKFQSWIGFNEVVIKTDHSSIVQWYKEDLCTISGPLRRRDHRPSFFGVIQIYSYVVPFQWVCFTCMK